MPQPKSHSATSSKRFSRRSRLPLRARQRRRRQPRSRPLLHRNLPHLPRNRRLLGKRQRRAQHQQRNRHPALRLHLKRKSPLQALPRKVRPALLPRRKKAKRRQPRLPLRPSRPRLRPVRAPLPKVQGVPRRHRLLRRRKKERRPRSRPARLPITKIIPRTFAM